MQRRAQDGAAGSQPACTSCSAHARARRPGLLAHSLPELASGHLGIMHSSCNPLMLMLRYGSIAAADPWWLAVVRHPCLLLLALASEVCEAWRQAGTGQLRL